MNSEFFLKNKSVFIVGTFFLIAVLVGGIFYQKGKGEQIPRQQEIAPRETELFVPPGASKETPKEAIKSIAKIEKPVELFLPQKCDVKDYAAPSGKISLSLRESSPGKHTALYEFDVEKKELKNFLADSCNNFAVNFSQNRGKITYISDCKENTAQVFTADSGGQNKKQITTGKAEKEMKTRPIFSRDAEKIAFTKLPFVSDILAEESGIYLTDLTGNEEFLTRGTMPIFSPDGKYLLVFKNPGLYLFDLKTKEAERVIELRDENQELIIGKINMMISLAPNGDRVAMSNMNRGELYVFDISSWKPFASQLMAQIKISGFWNTFSPDGKFLAVQEADIDKATSASKNPRLSIFETCAFSKLSSFSLENYDPYSMWVTSWQK